MKNETQNQANPSGEAFTRFWSDFLSKMAMPGATSAFAPSQDESFKKMRQAFFDSWAVSCDQVMRSEPFLDAMKSSMEKALAFKQQMNELLTKTLHEGQVPSRSDTDSILQVVRNFEERVLDKLEQLSRRVVELEEKRKTRKSSEKRKAAPVRGTTRPRRKP